MYILTKHQNTCMLLEMVFIHVYWVFCNRHRYQFFFLKPEKSPIFLKENIDIYYMKYAKLHFFDSFQVKKNTIHKGSSKTVFISFHKNLLFIKEHPWTLAGNKQIIMEFDKSISYQYILTSHHFTSNTITHKCCSHL